MGNALKGSDTTTNQPDSKEHPMSPSRLITSLSTATLLMLGVQASAATASYAIDPDHSDAIFRALHFNVGHVYGRFTDLGGVLTIDDAAPAKDSFEVTVAAESVLTSQEKRDKHIKGPDFFDVKQFPNLIFKSNAVVAVDAKTLEVTGDLTIHGVTKTVTVKVVKVGEGVVFGATRVGYETQFEIKRSDYGMNMTAVPAAVVADEVTIILAVEAIKK
jgi:polyisoprenoid-binding protein YceI